MVLAETVKMNAGEVMLLLALALAVLAASIAVTAFIGVGIGFLIGRRTLPTRDDAGLRTMSKALFVAASLVSVVLSYLLFAEVVGAVLPAGGAIRGVFVPVAALPLPIVWGLWSGRHYRFVDRPPERSRPLSGGSGPEPEPDRGPELP